MFKSRVWPSAGSGSCQAAWCSHGVVKHHILLGELQQHRVIEELADAHVLAETLQRVGAEAKTSPV